MILLILQDESGHNTLRAPSDHATAVLTRPLGVRAANNNPNVRTQPTHICTAIIAIAEIGRAHV